MRSTPAAAVTLAALLITLAACSTTDPATVPRSPAATSAPGTPTTAGGTPTAPATTGTPPGTGTTSPAQTVRVMLEKTGGIAGVQDRITVEPDGRWTVVDRSGSSRTGQLSAADLDRLRQLAADPRLATEAAATPGSTNCADAFTYQLTVAGRMTRYVDCPTDPNRPEVTAAVVDLLTRATR
ncbi:MAG: hypothetical protein WA890_24925 [Micromonospora sp.]